MPIRSLIATAFASPAPSRLLAVVLAVFRAGAPPTPQRGKTLYAACAACHNEKPDALGPNLKGVVGRKAAALDDFRYSAPMRRANVVWDDANLKRLHPRPAGAP